MISYWHIDRKMARTIVLCLASVLLSGKELAVEIAVPSPKDMIAKSDVIAVGHIETAESLVIFRADNILKGTAKIGVNYTLRSPFPSESFSERQLIGLTGGAQFVLIGRWDKQPDTIQPIYGLCSAWPQGTTAELLPQRTLPECVALIRATLQQEGPLAVNTPAVALANHNANEPSRFQSNTQGPSLNSSAPASTSPDAPVSRANRPALRVAGIILLAVLIATAVLLRFIKRRTHEKPTN